MIIKTSLSVYVDSVKEEFILIYMGEAWVTGSLCEQDSQEQDRLVPAQDAPYALIIWYVSKTIYSS